MMHGQKNIKSLSYVTVYSANMRVNDNL